MLLSRIAAFALYGSWRIGTPHCLFAHCLTFGARVLDKPFRPDGYPPSLALTPAALTTRLDDAILSTQLRHCHPALLAS